MRKALKKLSGIRTRFDPIVSGVLETNIGPHTICTESLENGAYPFSLVKNGKKRIFFACDEDADESY